MPPVACEVDWPGTMSFLKDFIVACAAIFTAYVAKKGIDKWRNEEAGKADFDLARRCMKSVFKLRDALAEARRIFISTQEYPDEYDSANARPAQEASVYAKVFTNRISPVRDCVVELQALRNEAEALWGDEPVSLLSELEALVHEFYGATISYVSNKRASGENFRLNPDLGASVEAKLFDSAVVPLEGGDPLPNPFTSRITETVGRVAEYLRTKLPQKPHSKHG